MIHIQPFHGGFLRISLRRREQVSVRVSGRILLKLAIPSAGVGAITFEVVGVANRDGRQGEA